MLQNVLKLLQRLRFFQDEEHIGMLLSSVIRDNASAMQKILMNNKRCTYRMIQKELNIEFSPIHKVIHKELNMKIIAFGSLIF